jgi:hypothetical protein
LGVSAKGIELDTSSLHKDNYLEAMSLRRRNPAILQGVRHLSHVMRRGLKQSLSKEPRLTYHRLPSRDFYRGLSLRPPLSFLPKPCHGVFPHDDLQSTLRSVISLQEQRQRMRVRMQAHHTRSLSCAPSVTWAATLPWEATVREASLALL